MQHPTIAELRAPLKLTSLQRLVIALSALFFFIFTVRYVHGIFVHGYDMAADFEVFWKALHKVVDQVPAISPYDLVTGRAFVSGDTEGKIYYPFLYAPTFVFYLWPFARLAMWQALLGWYAVQITLWFLALNSRPVKALWPKLATRSGLSYFGICAVLSSPFLVTAFMNGQTGILVSTTLLFGVSIIETCPYLAGAVFALGFFKPQLFLTVGLYVLLTRRYKVMVGGAVTYGLLVAISIYLWGFGMWADMFEAVKIQAQIMHNPEYLPHYFPLMVSVYSAMMVLSRSGTFSDIVQLACAVTAAFFITKAVLKRVAYAKMVPLLFVSIFMCSFYAYQYDMLILVTVMLLWMEEDFHSPLDSLPRVSLILLSSSAITVLQFQLLSIPIGVIIIALMFVRCAKTTRIQMDSKAAS